jgi:hypothetical protein
MKIGKDFFFRDDIKKDTVPIQLMNCIFEGVVLRYTKIQIHEEKGNKATIKFDYELIDVPKKLNKAKLKKSKEFKEHIGLILNSMILDVIDQTETKNNDRKDDSEELIEE